MPGLKVCAATSDNNYSHMFYFDLKFCIYWVMNLGVLMFYYDNTFPIYACVCLIAVYLSWHFITFQLSIKIPSQNLVTQQPALFHHPVGWNCSTCVNLHEKIVVVSTDCRPAGTRMSQMPGLWWHSGTLTSLVRALPLLCCYFSCLTAWLLGFKRESQYGKSGLADYKG